MWCDCTCARPNLTIWHIFFWEQTHGRRYIPSSFRFGKFFRLCICVNLNGKYEVFVFGSVLLSCRKNIYLICGEFSMFFFWQLRHRWAFRIMVSKLNKVNHSLLCHSKCVRVKTLFNSFPSNSYISNVLYSSIQVDVRRTQFLCRFSQRARVYVDVI